jgi:pyruvate/2-oxoglutarate dehydrogenase complex dihydrolipoamide acyltransferase (E2) component
LIELDAAKTTGTVNAPVSGTLIEVQAEIEQEVPVGQVITIGDPGGVGMIAQARW